MIYLLLLKPVILWRLCTPDVLLNKRRIAPFSVLLFIPTVWVYNKPSQMYSNLKQHWFRLKVIHILRGVDGLFWSNSLKVISCGVSHTSGLRAEVIQTRFSGCCLIFVFSVR